MTCYRYFGFPQKLGLDLTSRKIPLTYLNPGQQSKNNPLNKIILNFTSFYFSFQGLIKRRSLIKEGNRPIITIWRKYWMQLWGDALVLYASKLFSQGESRENFRNDPCKYVTIAGWHILVDVNR